MNASHAMISNPSLRDFHLNFSERRTRSDDGGFALEIGDASTMSSCNGVDRDIQAEMPSKKGNTDRGKHNPFEPSTRFPDETILIGSVPGNYGLRIRRVVYQKSYAQPPGNKS
jgi:hypothetical protein